MSHFYVEADEEYRCRRALLGKRSITIVGLTLDGRGSTFTGRVEAVEAGHTTIPGYPLRITIRDEELGELP